MVIAILIGTLRGGGAERSAALLSRHLEDRHQVYLFVTDDERIDYQYAGILVKLDNRLPLYRSILDKKKKYKVECAISFMAAMNIANIRTRQNECVIITHHNTVELLPVGYELLKRFYRYADMVVTCSYGSRQAFIDSIQLENGRLQTVYNLVDMELFKDDQLNNRLPEDVTDFLNGDDYALSIGRLTWEKNQLSLISQFCVYRRKYSSNLKLVIVGTGSLEDELKKEIIRRDGEGYIRIVPFTRDIMAFYQNAKVFLMTSVSEGLPNVICEAMCYGLPVISTDCQSGPRELLNDEQDYRLGTNGYRVVKRGVLVQRDTYDCDKETSYFADAMNFLLSNEQLMREISSEAKKYMEGYNEQIKNQWDRLIQLKPEKPSELIIEEQEYDYSISKAELVIVYGAGKVGRRVANELNNSGKNVCFAVSDTSEEKYIDGIPVYRIDMLIEHRKHAVVLLATIINDNLVQMIETVRRLGFPQWQIARF